MQHRSWGNFVDNTELEPFFNPLSNGFQYLSIPWNDGPEWMMVVIDCGNMRKASFDRSNAKLIDNADIFYPNQDRNPNFFQWTLVSWTHSSSVINRLQFYDRQHLPRSTLFWRRIQSNTWVHSLENNLFWELAAAYELKFNAVTESVEIIIWHLYLSRGLCRMPVIVPQMNNSKVWTNGSVGGAEISKIQYLIVFSGRSSDLTFRIIYRVTVIKIRLSYHFLGTIQFEFV